MVLDYSSNYGERGQWLTIHSTLPDAWKAVNEALSAHANEMDSDEGWDDSYPNDMPAAETVVAE